MGESSDYTVNPGNDPSDLAHASAVFVGEISNVVPARTHKLVQDLISGIGAGTVDVEEPPQVNLAPPGWYLLFILNASRIPSLGGWRRLTP